MLNFKFRPDKSWLAHLGSKGGCVFQCGLSEAAAGGATVVFIAAPLPAWQVHKDMAPVNRTWLATAWRTSLCVNIKTESRMGIRAQLARGFEYSNPIMGFQRHSLFPFTVSLTYTIGRTDDGNLLSMCQFLKLEHLGRLFPRKHKKKKHGKQLSTYTKPIQKRR